MGDVSVALGPAASSGCCASCLRSPFQCQHTCRSGAKRRPHNNIRWPWQYLQSTSSSNLTLTCHRGFISLKATHAFTFSFIGICLFPPPFWKQAWGGRGRREKSKPMDESLMIFILLLNRRKLWMQFKEEKYAWEKGFWLKTRKKNTSSVFSKTSEGGRS